MASNTVGVENSLDAVDKTIGDPYCFESDHVALKGNPDYHALLRTICILEAQRARAIEDLDLLYEAREKVLQDPVGFVDKLQHGADLGTKLPAPQKIAQLPVISWDKYTSSVDFASLGSHRHSTRLKRHAADGAGDDDSLMRLKSSLVGNPDGDSKNGIMDASGDVVVRGRMRDPSKSSTFNQLWTAEEQKRLEELLVRYPPEEIEAKRWQKIATALGNRTPQQVASRVQKYFIKLAKAGLPVPGRVPNLSAHLRRGSHRHQRYNRMYYPSSTFMQSYEPPVYMNDEDDYFDTFHDGQAESYAASEDRSSTQDNSDDEGVPEHLQDTAEYHELVALKQLRKEHLQSLDPSLVQHTDFKCDKCGCEPIVGTRWHCVDCPQDMSLDFCDSCADNLGTFETLLHNSSHRIRPVKKVFSRPSRKLQDQDYMRFMPGDYNYLDPNYMPAS